MNILKQLSKEEISALLRKPEGNAGVEIAKLMAEHNAFMNQLTYNTIQLQKNDDVLEMGIGNGSYFKQVKKIVQNGKLIGIDYSPTMIEKAIEINKELVDNKDIKIIHASIDNMPFENNAFSKIITVNTIYFWDNIDTYLKEIKRVLQIDGKLAIGFRPKHIMEQMPFAQQGFTFYSMEEIKHLLEKHCFKITDEKNEVDNQFANLEANVIVAQKY